MFKVTCFAPITPDKLWDGLKGLQFTKKKEGFEWYLDGHVFRIEPFKNQSRTNMKGYRVYFNGSIDGAIFLYDFALSWINPAITGIEFSLSHSNITSQDWIKDLMSRSSISTVDTKGIFKKGPIGIVVVNDEVVIQLRSSKGSQLNLLPSLKQIESIKEELKPAEHDLFSLLEEGVAI